MLDREALRRLAIELLHFLRSIGQDPRGPNRLAKPRVNQAGLAGLFTAARAAPERPLAHPPMLRRLRLTELRRFPTVRD